MASGHVNRIKGRTHGRTDHACYVTILLANSEPSTHGTYETSGDVRSRDTCGGRTDISQGGEKTALRKRQDIKTLSR
jgi:hypothetical protein